jgi:phosphoribosyl 1,2-cyclic phosphodiesterase
MKQIDHLVITHYHGDHLAGALTLVNLANPQPLRQWPSSGMPDNPGRAYFELKVDQRHIVKPGHDVAAQTGRGRGETQLHVSRRAKAVH